MAGWRLSLPLLLLAAGAVYIGSAGAFAIIDDGDALYSEAARQMVVRGDYVTPWANGVRFLDKPPLLYWLTAASFRILGFSEFAARLPSALAVLATVVLVRWLGTRAGGVRPGTVAGLCMAFSAGTFLFSRMVFPDALFVLLTTAALCCFVKWYMDARCTWPAFGFYGLLAAGAMTKGLLAVVFPVGTVLLFLLWQRDWHRLRNAHAFGGVLLFGVIALPWHVLAAARNEGFLWYYFVNEHLLRFLGRRQPWDYESIPLLLFWALILVWLLPWSAFLPAVRGLVSAGVARSPDAAAIARLCVSWTIVVLSFFSVSSRVEHYAYPFFPPLAVLLGAALSGGAAIQADARREVWVRRGFALLALIGALGLAALAAGAAAWRSGILETWLLAGPSSMSGHAQKTYFGSLFELPAATRQALIWPLAGTLLAFGLGMPLAWWADRKGMRIAAVSLLSLAIAVSFGMTTRSLAVCEEVLSTKGLATALSRAWKPGDRVIVAGDFESANSLNFYAGVRLEVVGGTAAVLTWGLRYPDAPRVLLDRPEFEAAWHGRGRAFLIASDSVATRLGVAGSQALARSGGRSLLVNNID